MSKEIWKYPIQVNDEQVIAMQTDARILCVHMQNGQPYIWAEVDPEAGTMKRAIRVFGTGHKMPEIPGDYIGTFQMMEGMLVFHAYAGEQSL